MTSGFTSATGLRSTLCTLHQGVQRMHRLAPPTCLCGGRACAAYDTKKLKSVIQSQLFVRGCRVLRGVELQVCACLLVCSPSRSTTGAQQVHCIAHIKIRIRSCLATRQELVPRPPARAEPGSITGLVAVVCIRSCTARCDISKPLNSADD